MKTINVYHNPRADSHAPFILTTPNGHELALPPYANVSYIVASARSLMALPVNAEQPHGREWNSDPIMTIHPSVLSEATCK